VDAAGNIAIGDVAAINAICTGATICAASRNAGSVVLRSQHGAAGAEAGPCLATQPVRCVFIAQCPQQALAIVPGDTQSAIPSTGANSTVRSNPDAISLRNCMICLYTARQRRICDFYHSY
jgi:hypothetical protein